MNRLRTYTALLTCVLLLAPLAPARTRKGDKLLKEGSEAESRKEYDKALDFYQQALQADPNDPGYQLAERRVRFKAAEVHVADGNKLRDQQKLQEALVEFQKAFLMDPSYFVALQAIRDTDTMIKEKAKLPADTPVLTPTQKAEKAVQERVDSLMPPPELRPLTNQITNLKMNNQSMRVLYDTVAKLAGINVLFDNNQGAGMEMGGGAGGHGNFNLDLNRVTLSEALDYIALLTHTFWKPISSNAIFVTADSSQKRQEYQDQVVKVFYIQNVGTQAEFQDFFNAVRTGANMNRGLIQLPSQNALIARGTPDQIAVIEKIIHDLDKPKAEVLIDVIVLEVSREKQRTLSAAIASAVNGNLAPGLSSAIQFTPRNPVLFGTTGTTTGSATGTTTGTATAVTTGNTTGTTTGNTTGFTTATTSTTGTTGTPQSLISLSKLGHISTNDFSTSLPGALVQALLTDTSSRVLQRPQLRATDGGKASLKIGSKIPVVSGSLNSAIGGAGAIPYATTQFQQVDVGVIMELQPHVNGPNDVSMHLKVEISQVNSYTNIAGVQQPIIGQRVNDAEIRMKAGEVSLLGGLSQDSTSLTNTGIPGLINVPILGYLFGSKYRDQIKDDILIAITPHIVRAPDFSALGEEAIETGTEQNVHVLRSVPSTATVNIPMPQIQPRPAAITQNPVSQQQPAQGAARQPQTIGPRKPSPAVPLPAAPGVRPQQ